MSAAKIRFVDELKRRNQLSRDAWDLYAPHRRHAMQHVRDVDVYALKTPSSGESDQVDCALGAFGLRMSMPRRNPHDPFRGRDPYAARTRSERSKRAPDGAPPSSSSNASRSYPMTPSLSLPIHRR